MPYPCGHYKKYGQDSRVQQDHFPCISPVFSLRFFVIMHNFSVFLILISSVFSSMIKSLYQFYTAKTSVKHIFLKFIKFCFFIQLSQNLFLHVWNTLTR